MTEAVVLFERKNPGEEALVLHNGLHNLENPKLKALLKDADFPADVFGHLVNGEGDWEGEPIQEDFKSSSGQLMEHLEIRIAKTPVGPVEVTETTAFPEGINPDDIFLHLKQPNRRGFEVVYVLDGEGSLFFPETVDPVAPGVYARSEVGRHVDLKAGDLVFTPAPTANGWSKVSEGFKFRYVVFPPWSPSFVKPTV